MSTTKDGAKAGRGEQGPTLDTVASLNKDGSRKFVHPADVSGAFNRARRAGFVVLLIILVGLPWVQIGGHPAVLLDVPRRQFFLFGETFNAQDGWLVFFLLTGVGFSLLTTAALFGRMWCGFACPQTVFVDGLYRQIERLIEGPSQERIKLEKAPWTAGKVVKRLVKHALYIALSIAIAHTILGYFFPIRTLVDIISQGPNAHFEAFLWTTGVTLLVYFDFGWFREQFCVIMCPYGRLQSLLTDQDTVLVGYDVKRGEPRGKLNVIGNGDCVDCKRCIAVCPTAIDIRQGLQLDCIGCTACIDACDDIMTKVKKPTGLIRLESEKGFAGGKVRLIRPRTIAYFIAGLAGLTAMTLALRTRGGYEAALLRPKGAPYAVEGGQVRNVMRVHLVNKSSTEHKVKIEPQPVPDVMFVVSQPEAKLGAYASIEVPIIAMVGEGSFKGDFDVLINVREGAAEPKVLKSRFLGPGK